MPENGKNPNWEISKSIWRAIAKIQEKIVKFHDFQFPVDVILRVK